MTEDPDLERAYRLAGVDDNRRLYADWAQSYDEDFAENLRYVLPAAVARAFAEAGGVGPVLDLGAGTGLLGVALAGLGVGPVDATDLSPEMLRMAEAKGVYRRCFEGNLLERLPVADGTYAGAVSSGTFTHGHVGPEALDEVLRVVVPGGWIVLSVNEKHWKSKGFATAFAGLGGRVDALSLPRVRIYAAEAEGEHAGDTAVLATFRRK